MLNSPKKRQLWLACTCAILLACNKPGPDEEKPPVQTGNLFITGVGRDPVITDFMPVLWDIKEKRASRSFIKNHDQGASIFGINVIKDGTGNKVYYYGLRTIPATIFYKIAYWNKDEEILLSNQFTNTIHHESLRHALKDEKTGNLYILAYGAETANDGPMFSYYYKITPAQLITRHPLPDREFGYGFMSITAQGLVFSGFRLDEDRLEVDVLQGEGSAIRHIPVAANGHNAPRVESIVTDANSNIFILCSADHLATQTQAHFLVSIKNGAAQADVYPVTGLPADADIQQEMFIHEQKLYACATVPGTSELFYLSCPLPAAQGGSIAAQKFPLELTPGSNNNMVWRIYRFNEKIYVTGAQDLKACYWENGKLQTLNNDGMQHSLAYLMYSL